MLNSDRILKLSLKELKELVARPRVSPKKYVSPTYQCQNGIKITCHTDCNNNWEPVLGTDGVDGFRCDDLIMWCDGMTEYDPAYICNPNEGGSGTGGSGTGGSGTGGSGTGGSGTYSNHRFDSLSDDIKLL